MPSVLAHGVPLWVAVALSIVGIVARPFGWPEAVWPIAGSAVLLATQVLSPAAAWQGVEKGLDVYLFLVGMMALAEIARLEGLFDWLAGHAVRRSAGSAPHLFALVYAVGVAVTTILSNDATAVVLTPAVYAAAKAAKAEALPHLFACALVANAASFVLPVANPANLVVYGAHMPSLGPWLARFGLPSLLSIVTTFAVLRFTQRASLRSVIAADVSVEPLSSTGKVAGLGIAATGLVLVASSALGLQLGLPTFIAGAVTATVVLLLQRDRTWDAIAGMSWSVIPLVAGLFVLVEAVERAGALGPLTAALKAGVARSEIAAGAGGGAIVAFASNLVNNLPAGLFAGAAVQNADVPDRVAGAILIGVDLGPNLSVTGSLATILWLVAIRREGADVSSWAFLKLGAVAMPTALVAALGALLLMPF